MNIRTENPAYIVQARYPVESQRNRTFTFRDGDLLTARQAAFQKAQLVVAGKSIHDAIDIEIDLIATNRHSVPNQQQVIATVFKQRFNRTSFISDEGKDTLTQVDAFVAKSLPKSVFLTIGLEQGEAGNSLEVVEKTLTADELIYYRQQGYQSSTSPLF